MFDHSSEKKSGTESLDYEIAQNKELLALVNRAAAILLTASDEENVEGYLTEGIGLISRYIDIDRVYIYRNEKIDGELYYTLAFRWLGNPEEPEKDVPVSTRFPYSKMPGWEEKFLKGECVNGAISDLSKNEQDFYKEFLMKSVLVIPVFLQEQFWGIVSYNDYQNERFFTGVEVEILRNASMMMMNAIYGSEQTARIRQANERGRLLLDSTPLCCEIWDQDLNLFDCNEEAVKFFGAKDKQELMEKYFELSPEYQPDGMLSVEKGVLMLKKALEEGECVYEWTHHTLGGTPIPCEITLVRVDYEDGYAVAAYNRDLREHKKMMTDIEHRDALLNTVNQIATILLQSDTGEFQNNLLHAMGMLGQTVNADRVYIWRNYNQGDNLYCAQLYEWSAVTKSAQDSQEQRVISYDENVPTWEEILSNRQCVNKIVRDMPAEEQALLSPQGILSILVVPVFLRDYFWGFIGFDDCRNERVFSESEEVILRSGSLLIANSILRNDMTQELAAALGDAQAASRAKSEFLSNMSHEIRTPLNAVIGMTSIGISSAEQDRKQYCFSKIASASSHLLGVVNDILDMSKIEAGKFELSSSVFNFDKMIQRVIDVIHFRINEKHQNFKMQIDNSIPGFLIGDDQRLAQVITNLLGNAVKFTPERGEIRLAINTIDLNSDGCQIQIDVHDTGIGISEEEQAKLFRSFQQAESGTSRKFGGTGLGLVISKNIIEMMGGEIWVKSEPGKGSVFSFTAKLGKADEKSNKVSYCCKEKISHLKILSVDDEPEELKYFIEVANRAGLSCDTALGGEEALALIGKGNPYNIYFIDSEMPGIDGIELSRRIRDKDAEKELIILVASFDQSITEAEALKAGVDRIVSKPILPSIIIDIVNDYTGIDINNIEQNADSGESMCFDGCHILLADDVEINREIAIALFEPTMLKTDCAVNGAEAVRMFTEAPDKYDLIFMDIQMPEMDGYEATGKIRAMDMQKAKDIPIVAMTANVFREDIEKCIEAGMDDHVGKPLDMDIIMDVLRKYLGKAEK